VVCLSQHNHPGAVPCTPHTTRELTARVSAMKLTGSVGSCGGWVGGRVVGGCGRWRRSHHQYRHHPNASAHTHHLAHNQPKPQLRGGQVRARLSRKQAKAELPTSCWTAAAAPGAAASGGGIVVPARQRAAVDRAVPHVQARATACIVQLVEECIAKLIDVAGQDWRMVLGCGRCA